MVLHPDEYALFPRQAPGSSAGWPTPALRLFTLWLALNRQEERRRLQARRADPLKPCKLRRSTMHRWNAGMPTPGLAGAMFATTHTPLAQWVVAIANDKRSAPINATLHVPPALPYDGQEPEVAAALDPAMVAPLDQVERSRPRVHAAGHR